MKHKLAFNKFGVMVDCSRNSVMTVNSIKKLIDILSALGYNTIKLYTEDTFEVTGEPYFGYLRGRYSKNELKDIDAYAKEKGIELIPCIQTLAHLNAIFRWKKYQKICDIGDILLIDSEDTYNFIENIFKTISETFTSRKVNIGMDEAHLIGRGQYYDLHGDTSHTELIKRHLLKVLDIAKKYGFECEMWSDMFFRLANGGYYVDANDNENYKKVAKSIPDNVTLVYWDYYSTNKEHYDNFITNHLKITNKLAFAGGAWTWSGFCPNNHFSIQATKLAIQSCKENKVKDFTLTMWGDDGGECSPFMVLPTLVSASCFAKGIFDEEKIKKTFKRIVGMDFDLFMALDLPDKFAASTTYHCNNPSKYMLYNDLFKGIFDKNISEGSDKFYTEVSNTLTKGKLNKKWGYLFKNICALSDVLAIKYNLGKLTRDAYNSGDKTRLDPIIKYYNELIKKLETFYNAFETYWMTEKKPHGFDVQDARLGGLIMRVKHCKKMLEDYKKGKTFTIPELEEELLCPLDEDAPKTSYNFNAYAKSITTNVF